MSGMDKALSSLKNKQLKHLVFLTGCASPVTKHGLQQQLTRRLSVPMIGARAPRILSVDMGIRNLAFCVVEPVSSAASQSKRDGSQLSLRVSAWEKVDLLEQIKSTTVQSADSMPGVVASDADALDLFNPASVSQVAYDLSRSFLTHEPTTILIERQRYRSAGSSAIQEWTIRVNMLESMLWACLTTIRKHDGNDDLSTLSIQDVSPKRVANFWVGSNSGKIAPSEEALDSKSTPPDITALKIKKQDRQKVLQEWLAGGDDARVRLDFTGSALKTAAAFEAKGAGRRRTIHNGSEQRRKLDDLTDCLLQGAAWYQWEANRRSILSMMQTRLADLETKT